MRLKSLTLRPANTFSRTSHIALRRSMPQTRMSIGVPNARQTGRKIYGIVGRWRRQSAAIKAIEKERVTCASLL
jgi:hypothetical protein